MRLQIALVGFLTVGSLLTPPASADDAVVIAEVKAAKSALDSAFERHDAAVIERMLTPDHIGVTSYYGKPLNTADELATLAEREVRYSDFTEVVVTVLGPDTAMVTFENGLEGTFQGRALPARVFTSEIWLMQGGIWRQRLFQETPIMN